MVLTAVQILYQLDNFDFLIIIFPQDFYLIDGYTECYFVLVVTEADVIIRATLMNITVMNQADTKIVPTQIGTLEHLIVVDTDEALVTEGTIGLVVNR